MLVSVVVITYNHEKYIKQALESILMQKRDFDLEVLVGDDCSIDNTPKIVGEYARKYPDIIKVKLRKINLGATRNSYELFNNAKGDYIAILEGDDYWIDEYKLMKQVNFLKKNSKYAACCCKFNYVNEKGIPLLENKEKMLRGQLYNTNEIYTLDDLCKSTLPSHASTMVLRNIFRDKNLNSKVIYKAHETIGDFTVVMLILSKGEIYRLNDAMSCYRHIEKTGSAWSAKAYVNPFHFYEIFMYHTYLENYARKNLGLNLQLKITKDHAFYVMTQNFFHRQVPAMKQCLKNMLRVTENKTHYLYMYINSRLILNVPSSIKAMYAYRVNKKVMPLLKKRWKQFYNELGRKKVILYGAGGACIDFLNEYFFDIPVYCVVDNDPEKQGTYIEAYKTCDNSVFSTLEKNEYIVIITSGLYMNEIARQLHDMGIKYKQIYSYAFMESKRLKYFFFTHFAKNYDYLKER